MSAKDITFKILWDKVQEIAEKNPSFIYKAENPGGACMYAGNAKEVREDGSESFSGPRCIIGEAFHELGVPQSHLERINQGVDPMDALSGLHTLDETLGDTDVAPPLMHDAYYSACCEAQEYQDSGMCWADAVEMASGAVKN